MANPRGLASLLSALKFTCKIIGKFGIPLRDFVPTGNQSAYDTALAAITAACTVILAIDWFGDETGANQ